MDIMWTGVEVEDYERLKTKSRELQQEMPAYVKKILKRSF